MTDNFNELFEERMKTNDTRLKLDKLIALNLQLFNAIITYDRQNNLPLTFNPRIINIIRKIEEEETEINYPNRRKVTAFKTDEDETESTTAL